MIALTNIGNNLSKKIFNIYHKKKGIQRIVKDLINNNNLDMDEIYDHYSHFIMAIRIIIV